MKVIVEQQGNGWKAYTPSKPKQWEVGLTKAEAVYYLLITFGKITILTKP